MLEKHMFSPGLKGLNSQLTRQTAGFRAWTTKEENSFSSES